MGYIYPAADGHASHSGRHSGSMKHSVKRCRAGVHLIISSDNSVPLSLPSEWFRQVAVMLAQDELFIPRNRSLLFSFELSSTGLVRSSNNSRMLRGHRTTSVLRLPTSSRHYLMVRNHCCGRVFHLPVHLILPSPIRLSRSAPQLTASQALTRPSLCCVKVVHRGKLTLDYFSSR